MYSTARLGPADQEHSTVRMASDREVANAECSPDGRRIAMDMRTEGQSDIWVYDWDRDTLNRLTFDPTNEDFPVWTSDDTRIVYRSFKSAVDAAGYSIAWRRADGTGGEQVLVHDTVALRAGAWHPKMNVLAYVRSQTASDDDILLLSVEGNEVQGWTPKRPTVWLRTPAGERTPAFSPDGSWISYTSDESGPNQVYVRPFSGAGPRVTVSPDGGDNSSWSSAGAELLFAGRGSDYQGRLMVVRYGTQDGTVHFDKPRPWAERSVGLRSLRSDRTYALHPDGARVAIAPPSESRHDP